MHQDQDQIKNNPYKLVAIDMDGTLLSSDNKISAENKAAILAAMARGVKVVICSGRSYHSLRLFAESIGTRSAGNYVIAFNGGMLLDAGTDEVIFETRMDRGLAMEIVEAAKPFEPNAATIVYRDVEHILVRPNSPHITAYVASTLVTPIVTDDINSLIADDVQKVLLGGYQKDLQAPAAFLREKFAGRCNMNFSGEYLFECNELHTTKAAGLVALCRHLGLSMNEVIAIGDHYNDLSMIEAAGLGVCMSNGADGVKATADYITTRDNNHSGVAEVLDKFILQ